MSAGLQITGWPAHDSAINSILFGPDETSIFSLGSDGKVIVISGYHFELEILTSCLPCYLYAGARYYFSSWFLMLLILGPHLFSC